MSNFIKGLAVGAGAVLAYNHFKKTKKKSITRLGGARTLPVFGSGMSKHEIRDLIRIYENYLQDFVGNINPAEFHNYLVLEVTLGASNDYYLDFNNEFNKFSLVDMNKDRFSVLSDLPREWIWKKSILDKEIKKGVYVRLGKGKRNIADKIRPVRLDVWYKDKIRKLKNLLK